MAALLLGAAALALLRSGVGRRRRRLAGWTHPTAHRIRPAGKGPPVRLVTAAAGLAVGAVLGGPVAAGVLAGGAGGLAHAVLRLRGNRSADRLRAAWIEVLAGAVAELRAGRSPPEALRVAVDLVPDAPRSLRQAVQPAAGESMGDRLRAAGSGSRSGVAQLLPVAWEVAERSGAGLADVLAGLERELRHSQDLHRRLRTELAGSRASAALLAGLPLVGLGLGAALGADPLGVLLHTPAGAVCVAVGGTLEGLGLAWTGRLCRSAESWAD